MKNISTAILLTFFIIATPNLVYAQDYDEKFEITDPTFEQRSKEERLLENRQVVEDSSDFKRSPNNKNTKKPNKRDEAPNFLDF
ncbi:hypothetical protein LBMAG20_08330 [Methylocystaceae bacterium]|nr:hypothetical protein LBMAG20_08330 [Methylocystaceae bacterium]